MFVTLIPKIGGAPLRVEASQLLVCREDGTPVIVAGEYGPPGTIKVAHGGDKDFNLVLRAFGHGRHTVVTERLQLDTAPSGAKLIAGPGM